MTTEFIAMRGISGSGKSTRAAELRSMHTNMIIVCRDDLRLALYGVAFGPPIDEDFITNVEHTLIRRALDNGISVINDNTHLTRKSIYAKLLLARSLGAHLHLEEVPASVDVAKQRNTNRATAGGRFVPNDVIETQAVAFDRHRHSVHETFKSLGGTVYF
jgi:predicted ABC-type ATPase